MNIFEQASRMAARFPSVVGALTTEQLWDLPLKAPVGSHAADLDSVAREVNRMLKEVGEENFVDDAPSLRRNELALKLDIVKHVIESKKADRDRAEKAAETRERKKRLLAILANKKDEELAGKSVEELEKEIEELDAA